MNLDTENLRLQSYIISIMHVAFGLMFFILMFQSILKLKNKTTDQIKKLVNVLFFITIFQILVSISYLTILIFGDYFQNVHFKKFFNTLSFVNINGQLIPIILVICNITTLVISKHILHLVTNDQDIINTTKNIYNTSIYCVVIFGILILLKLYMSIRYTRCWNDQIVKSNIPIEINLTDIKQEVIYPIEQEIDPQFYGINPNVILPNQIINIDNKENIIKFDEFKDFNDQNQEIIYEVNTSLLSRPPKVVNNAMSETGIDYYEGVNPNKFTRDLDKPQSLEIYNFE